MKRSQSYPAALALMLMVFACAVLMAFNWGAAAESSAAPANEAPAQIASLIFPTATRTPTPVNFGNFVWDDFDQDGRQDAGEPGIAGVTVQLWNSTKTDLVDSGVTNSSGIYSVQSPGPGNYRIRVLLPGGSDQFSPKDNAAAGDSADSDVNPSGLNLGFTDIIVVPSNVISIANLDAGIILFRTPTPTRTPTPVNFGNFVWDDLDGDGRQDVTEPGLAGVTVQLWNSAKSSLIDQDTTNASGIYSLQSPGPGTYRVRVVLPGLLDQFSPQDQAGGDDLLDSDINPSGGDIGFTDVINVASNVISISSIDAGIIKFRTATPTRTPTPINIGNFVWDDIDQDGRQDPGEPGIAGVTVQLWNSTKTALLSTATTNSNGNYTVIAPIPGSYRIRVLLPTVQDQFSPKDQASGNDQEDSDINPSGTNLGFTDVFTLASNVISTTTLDAGIIVFRTATPTRTPTPINIGNFVWNDLNGDGDQDLGEPGLNGITVQLWNSTKTDLIATTASNASGSYTVVAPVPGSYRIRVLLPAGASFTLKDQAGGDDQDDSDINPSGTNFGFSDIFTLASNVISTTIWDAGLINVSATATYTVTPTVSNTPSPTITLTPSDTPSPTITLTPTDTPTATETLDPSITPTLTYTPVPSLTPTATETLDPSITPTLTPNPIITDTPEPTLTPTASETPDPAWTLTPTPTDGLVFSADTATPTATPTDGVILTAAPATPTTTATYYFPTPPAAPQLGASADGPVRASVPAGADLYARPLVEYGEFITYYGIALTDAASVGVAGLDRLGILQAVDLFSPSGRTYFEGGFVVCLEGAGTLIWLNAANAPRFPEIIGSYAVPEWPGFTCATLFMPGSLVLVQQNPLTANPKR